MTQLPVANADWRTRLRQYLHAHMDKPVPVYELWDRFGVDMPLHHATRIWSLKGGPLPLTDRPMRWRAFCNELSAYRMRLPGAPREWSLGETVLPVSRVCGFCGGRFVGRMRLARSGVPYCSPSCGAKARDAAPAAAEWKRRPRKKQRETRTTEPPAADAA